MKILFIVGAYPPERCGIGDYSFNLVNELVKNKNVEIILLNSCEIVENGQPTPIRKIKWRIYEIFRLLRIIKNLKFDFINLQFPSKSYRKSVMIILLMVILYFSNKKIILTLHEFSNSNIFAKLRTLPLIFCCNRIIVVDKKYEIDINNIFRKSSKKIKFIRVASSIPQSKIKNNKEKCDELRLKYVKEDGMLLGYFGFVNKTKGIETIIKVSEQLKLQCINFKIILITELDTKKSYHRSLIDLINRNNLQNNIIITNYLSEDEVANHLCICDYVLLPFKDGLSTKNTSYFAAKNQGVKIITTSSTYSSSVADNSTMFIEKFDDVNAILEIILKKEKLFNNNKCKDYSYEDICKETLEIYESVYNNF